MKTKTIILCMLLMAFTLTQTFGQRQFFDNGQDLLLANFDLKPDEDDVHSAAALACMLKHPDLAGVDYHAVAGAFGMQGGTYITTATPGLFNTLFGPKNQFWSDLVNERNATLNRVRDLIASYILDGNQVFVQEAGQSDFTYDVLQKVINETAVTTSQVNNNVIVVQHSWQAPNLDFNERQTTPFKLTWVKNNTDYVQVQNGNVGNNGSPQFKSNSSTWLNQAKANNNPNADARTFWTQADAVCDNFTSSFENGTISQGGIDYSDCVENWWIFNIGSNVTNTQSFWNRYVVNTPAPTGCNPPYSVPNQQVNGNQSLNQTFGPFDISCSNVDISFTAVGSGGLETSGGAQDNLGVFYKINGGANQPILDISGPYAQNNLSATNLSGNTLELVIIMNTTGGSENYTVSNINITQSSGGNIDVTGVNVTPNVVPPITTAGGTSQLGVEISPSNATNKNVTWSSSNTSVATVNASGLVTAVANGTTTITATSVSNPGVSGSESVTVNISNQGGCNPPYTVADQQVNGNQSLNQTFGPFDISCSSVDISFTAVGSGGLESSGSAQDNLGVFYKVDGGANQPILDISGVYAQNNLSASNISGNSLELVIIMNTTGGSENYTVSNINISASSNNPPVGNNLLSNPGFETGDLTSYGSWGGVSVVPNNQRSGSFAVTVNGAGAPSQVVNVSPNTTYNFSVWGRVAAGGQSVNVGVKNHDAPETTSQLTSTSYTNVTHTFTTGPNATTAQVYFYCPNASYQAWGDDFELTVATTGARTSKLSTQSPIEEVLNDKNHPSLLYPNPLGARALKVNLSGYEGVAEINILDISGKLVFQTSTNQSELELNPTIFTAKGVYLINIHGSEKSEVLRLVVE